MRNLHPTLLLPLLTLSCGPKDPSATEPKGAAGISSPEEIRTFVEKTEEVLGQLWVVQENAWWNHETDINPETAAVAADVESQVMAAVGAAVAESAHFADVKVDPVTDRKLALMRRSTTLPAPDDDDARAELAGLVTEMPGLYGQGQYCVDDNCRRLEELSDVLAEGKDPEAMLDAWVGWRTVSPPMRPLYERFVELGNAGAVEMGYSDLGVLWRSGYDMPADDFAVEVDRLWGQLAPLYEQLHCYTRAKLSDHYGAEVVPPQGPIPAHMLGNMWAQDWSSLYPLLAPYPDEPAVNITSALEAGPTSAEDMVRYGEKFFTDLGFDPLPESFWERSMLVRPDDREVVCHASAWDPDHDGDLRLKMCIRPTQEDFFVIHHELGHLYYFWEYRGLSPLFQSGAHDGFHEAIGDTLLLSVTPRYLQELGLLETLPDPERAVLNEQMRVALERLAFLPFSIVVDQWRWKVFSGEVTPEQYNAAWWNLRTKLQGIESPVPRSEADFDPGAKYHIPANTPYTRYFLSSVLQFQLHRGLCDVAGFEGDLHTCSIQGNAAAGARYKQMLAMGASQPWPDALEVVTGQRQMDAQAMVDYFAPLMTWLEEQNEGQTCGW
ncbi:MAG: M2 family metallopeptidase [Alphaproteobacteria bacterium]|nr:M2 family metallopeptidase [Alphaproteobacteria bacterium]